MAGLLRGRTCMETRCTGQFRQSLIRLGAMHADKFIDDHEAHNLKGKRKKIATHVLHG